MHKRRLLKLGLFVLLGAIVNVAVAWGCAVWVSLPRPMGWSVAGEPARWLFERRQAFGSVRVHSHATDELLAFSYDVQPKRDKGPLWSRVSNTEQNQVIMVEDGRGWPCVSLLSVLAYEGTAGENWISSPDGFFIPETWRTRGGLRIRGRERSEDILVLPFAPLWPGFAINTIFYAAILWLLFAAPFKVRRWRRIRRGLCRGCGYDLRGRGHGHSQPAAGRCPECGAEPGKS